MLPAIAICIATYLRPASLTALLASIHRLDLTGMGRVIVVVVDNDVGGSARNVVEAAREEHGLPVVYLVEPERNIARARNRGVAEALRQQADLVAFVDDDEIVSPEWLKRLVKAQRRFGSHAVGGTVVPLFPPGTPAWIDSGGFFHHQRAPTGTPVRYVHTNNVLVSSRLLREVEGPFDAAFGVSGGEDSVFFSYWRRRGAKFVFVEEAVVHEQIPSSRARPGWILQRAYRVGNVAVWMERTGPGRLPGLMSRVAKGTARLALGAASAVPLSLLRGRAGGMRALWNIAYGAGCLAGLIGIRYREYTRVHGE